MRKEKITDKEAFCMLMLFIMGSTLILGIGGEAKNDAWLSGIAGVIMSLPIIIIYIRILTLFEGKDIFEILEFLFGAILGRVVMVIYILYSFHLGALVLRNFGEFINTVTMPETPIFVPMLGLGLLCIAAVRLGVEEIARFSTYLLPILIGIIAIIIILGIPEYHMHFLKPVLGNGIAPVIGGGFSAFSFPFTETVLFLGVFSALKNKKSPKRTYLPSILLGGALITILTIRNICILGSLTTMLYFPSYVAVARIKVGDFLQRMEVTVAIVFTVGAFVKSSVCLLVASKGITKVFKLKEYRSIVLQLGLLMIYFSYTVYDSIMEMRFWAFRIYEYYAFPMQVIIPIIIWIFAEIKHKRAQ